jgi:hypothetical protein
MIDLPPSVDYKPLTQECIVRSAESMGIAQNLLEAVLQVEGGWVGLAQPNKNKKGEVVSYDLGPAQVNSYWFDYFEKKGITPHQLRNNGCINVMAGAHILAYELSRSKTISEGVARYNARSANPQRTYLKKVIHALKNKLPASRILARANKNI